LFPPIAKRFGKIVPREPRVFILPLGLAVGCGLREMNSS